MMKITIQKKDSEMIPVEKKLPKPKPINIDDEDFFGTLSKSNRNIQLLEEPEIPVSPPPTDEDTEEENDVEEEEVVDVDNQTEKVFDINMKDYLTEDSVSVDLYYFEHP